MTVTERRRRDAEMSSVVTELYPRKDEVEFTARHLATAYPTRGTRPDGSGGSHGDRGVQFARIRPVCESL